MLITGGCHCGAIRYQAEIDPQRVSICHCTDCQRLTGSAYRVTAPALAESFTLISGEPRSYAKHGESGALSRQFFCPNCGSPLYRTDGEGRLDRHPCRQHRPAAGPDAKETDMEPVGSAVGGEYRAAAAV